MGKLLGDDSHRNLRGNIASMTIEEAPDGGIFLACVEHIRCAALKPGCPFLKNASPGAS